MKFQDYTDNIAESINRLSEDELRKVLWGLIIRYGKSIITDAVYCAIPSTKESEDAFKRVIEFFLVDLIVPSRPELPIDQLQIKCSQAIKAMEQRIKESKFNGN